LKVTSILPFAQLFPTISRKKVCHQNVKSTLTFIKGHFSWVLKILIAFAVLSRQLHILLPFGPLWGGEKKD
jgi:hypothetical protein